MIFYKALLLSAGCGLIIYWQNRFFQKQAKAWSRLYRRAETNEAAYYCFQKVQSCYRCARFFNFTVPFLAIAALLAWSVLS